MKHIDVILDDQEFTQANTLARQAGGSLEQWIRRLIHDAALSPHPSDPLFGLLADEPELADAIDAVVAERPQRELQPWLWRFSKG